MLQKVERNAKSLNEHRELSWLAQKVEDGRKSPFSEVVTITPTIAKHILENNVANRDIRERYVAQIASDIRDGNWQLNGESIILAKDGSLNDGQHRLHAVIESGEPIRTVVMFGVERDSRFTVDMGAARGVHDVLGMDGVKNRNNAASIAKMYQAYLDGQYSDRGNTHLQTKQAVRKFYYKHRKEIDRAAQVVTNCKFMKRFGVTAFGVAHILFEQKDKAASALFFHKVSEGTDLKRGDAILTLRMHMTEVREDNLRANEKLELIIRYWNAWRTGRSLSRRMSILRSFPEIG